MIRMTGAVRPDAVTCVAAKKEGAAVLSDLLIVAIALPARDTNAIFRHLLFKEPRGAFDI